MKSTFSTAIPTWLSSLGPILIRKQNRNSKFDPLVEEAELIEANPEYALIKLSNGRHTNISLKHLAPKGDEKLLIQNMPEENPFSQNSIDHSSSTEGSSEALPINQVDELDEQKDNDYDNMINSPLLLEPSTSRPIRHKIIPKYLEDYVLK